MRLCAIVLALSLEVFGANCVPAGYLRPVDSLLGKLSEENCRLSDGSVFAEYILTLPTQGATDLAASSSEFPVTILLRDSSGRRIADGSRIQRTLERGEYSVLINTTDVAMSGAFVLKAGFLPEPGTLCRTFRSLGVRSALTGKLVDSSCRLPDDTPYDGYRLSPLSPGTIDILLDSQDFEVYLVLRGSDGRAAASDAKRITVPVRADEDYTIIAAAGAGDARGEYKLAVDFAPAADDPCQAGRTIEGSQDVRGTIGDTGCRSGDTLLYHFFPLRISEPGVADLRLSGPDLAASLSLLGADGRLLFLDTGSGGPRRPILLSQLDKAEYFVRITAAKPGGDYTLEYKFRPGLPEICPALQLTNGATVAGALSGVASCRSRDTMRDVYRIVLPSSGKLEIAMTSGDFDPVLVLGESKDHELVESGGAIAADLPAGAYSLAAAGRTPGGYSIGYVFTPADPPLCKPQTFAVNKTLIAELGSTACRGPDGQPADVYEFTVPASGVVAAIMTSAGVDSYLTLTDSKGVTLRQDDNSYGDDDSLLIQYLPADTYRLIARPGLNGKTGRYRLDLLHVAGDRPAGCRPSGELAAGDTRKGSLGVASCQWIDETFADIYTVTLAEAATLDISLSAARFDAFLYVLDAKGNVIELDDNSGGGNDSHIVLDLDAGTYSIVATSYAGNGYAAGEYTVAIR